MENEKQSSITKSNQSSQTPTVGGTQNVPSGAPSTGGKGVIAGAGSSAPRRTNGRLGKEATSEERRTSTWEPT